MTCNNKCIHYPVCGQKDLDFANIEECPYYVEQEPQGEWIYKEFDEETGIRNSYFCSKCGCPQGQVYINFCGNCGAKMKVSKCAGAEENDCVPERCTQCYHANDCSLLNFRITDMETENEQT